MFTKKKNQNKKKTQGINHLQCQKSERMGENKVVGLFGGLTEWKKGSNWEWA